MIDKRTLFRTGLGTVAGLAFGAAPARVVAQGREFAQRAPLKPVVAAPDRVVGVTVCLRPFRAAGPRIEVEMVGGKRVVHNYGHGGSGWSLSWGSALEAVPLALADGATEVAVLGAGAIGLTSAITAQRMGANVTIYAKARFPQTASAKATGGWTPSARVAMAGGAAPDFSRRWERMARASFATHQSYLGMAGSPVEWTDRYALYDANPEQDTKLEGPPGPDGRRFVELDSLVGDLTPRPELLAAGTHPFAAPFVTRTMSMTYNIADLSRQLENDFMVAGGRFRRIEFRDVADLAQVREAIVLNCTGYGAQALFRDQGIVPVRGQIAWLAPQVGVDYGVRDRAKGLSVLGRRDGIVVQRLGADDFFGFGDRNDQPDLAAAHADVELAATFYNKH